MRKVNDTNTLIGIITDLDTNFVIVTIHHRVIYLHYAK